jgi:hypothetical protein
MKQPSFWRLDRWRWYFEIGAVEALLSPGNGAPCKLTLVNVFRHRFTKSGTNSRISSPGENWRVMRRGFVAELEAVAQGVIRM